MSSKQLGRRAHSLAIILMGHGKNESLISTWGDETALSPHPPYLLTVHAHDMKAKMLMDRLSILLWLSSISGAGIFAEARDEGF